MTKRKIYLVGAMLLVLGIINVQGQGRISKTMGSNATKVDNASGATRASRNTGSSSSGTSGIGNSTQKQSGSSTASAGSGGPTGKPNNVIHLNSYTRKDGKLSAVYGSNVTTKNGRRHVTGSGTGADKTNRGHIVKSPEGKTEYHRTMNGRVVVNKKNK